MVQTTVEDATYMGSPIRQIVTRSRQEGQKDAGQAESIGDEDPDAQAKKPPSPPSGKGNKK
jgi:hypothetical protein